MADLDLPLGTHLFLQQNGLAVTSSEQNLVPAMASGHAADVFNVAIANVHASTTEVVTVRRYVGATATIIAKVPLKAGGVLIVVSENARRFLNDGDKITVQGVSASGVFEATADWKEYS